MWLVLHRCVVGAKCGETSNRMKVAEKEVQMQAGPIDAASAVKGAKVSLRCLVGMPQLQICLPLEGVHRYIYARTVLRQGFLRQQAAQGPLQFTNVESI